MAFDTPVDKRVPGIEAGTAAAIAAVAVAVAVGSALCR